MRAFSFLNEQLEKRGFTSRPVRRVAVTTLLVSAALAVSGVLLLPWTRWPLWLALGAILSAWNFISLAWVMQRIFNANREGRNISRKIIFAQVAGTNLRLFITGILVYVSLVSFNANVFALTAGLSVTVLLIPPLALVMRDRPEDTPDQGRN